MICLEQQGCPVRFFPFNEDINLLLVVGCSYRMGQELKSAIVLGKKSQDILFKFEHTGDQNGDSHQQPEKKEDQARSLGYYTNHAVHIAELAGIVKILNETGVQRLFC